MWLWIISSIAGSILGGAANSWFADTRLGIWFYNLVDNISIWTSNKLHLKMLREEERWKIRYPNLAKRMDSLESNLNTIISKLDKRA
tara:strand:+ start:7483 stop:7743 length:261 start_codon:yes stop_codon:yes gene_type:complete